MDQDLSPSQYNQYNVRLGVWTNKSRGPVLGATLTVSKQDANLLISFMAFFIGYVGTRFWRVICIVLHRLYSTSKPMDAVYHQRQAILRNASSASSALSLFLRASLAWRRAKARCFVRILPGLVSAVCCLCAFVVAGGFSGRILTAIGDEVLLDGANCSTIKFARSELAIYLTWQIETLSAAINYAFNCYSSGITSSTLACNTYVVDKLPTAVMGFKAPCPFQGNICRSNTSNLLLDTGFIDSNDHLGLNFDPENRILFRKVLQCAPLITEGHDASYKIPGFNYTQYDYGNGFVRDLNYTRTELNYTYEVRDWESQYKEDYNKLATLTKSFILRSIYADVINRTHSPSTQFIPAPNLRRTDADMCLVFLSGNGVVFSDATHDNWYRGNVPCHKLLDEGNKRTFQYCPEDAASPIACLEQFQVCNGNVSRCGPLASFENAWREAAEAFDSRSGAFVNEAASRLTWFMLLIDSYPTRLFKLISSAGSDSLLSRHNLANGVQRRLLKNQWQLDVIFWWSTSLAVTQATFVEASRGIIDPSLARLREFPSNGAQKEMCMSQKITSTAHDSFSLFGVLFTFIAGFLIIITSYILEPLFAYLYRKSRYREYSHLEWTANGTLQLQRLAHEGQGLQDWAKCDEEVPITDPMVYLASLDISDLDHPRLCYPGPSNRSDQGSEQHAFDVSSGGSNNVSNTFDEERINMNYSQQQNPPAQSLYAYSANQDSEGEIEDMEHEEIELWGPLQTHRIS
ncbi:hypothetical protein GGR53DRAFT_532247 [Hypoxylon sp. FL1150]|nr:hypothetical protein GGR53DRAFT_532247 [Hypoxylon sp. FL1150]